MDELQQLQKEAFEAIRALAEASCFLRVSLTNDALWVCDLPRRAGDTSRARKALEQLGIVCRMDERSRLWKLDATDGLYAAWNAALPKHIPALPSHEALHGVYALCRLLLLHPSPVERQPRVWIRAALKQSRASVLEMSKLVAPAHAACAELLRMHEPLPSMAGGILSEWLASQEAGA